MMHNILLVTVQLDSEAAVWRASEKYVLLYTEKSFVTNSSREVHLLVTTQFTGLQC